MSDLLEILRSTNAADLKNSTNLEIETYQLSKYHLLRESIYFSLSVLFLMLSQSNNFLSSSF